MKATLIIKNIHKLYASSPGSDVFSCIEHAFVAVHHARIIDLGTHDHQQWIDKDTRIIDASNEIVVPSFIDAHVRFCFDRRSGDRKGADADMIVFQARDLEELFCSFGRQRLHRIIHQGVHIYPHVII